jgi:glucose-1-phosphate adenylyltransferase
MHDTIGVVLGGGKSQRLKPITDKMSKLIIYILANWKPIDFALTNMVLSGIEKILVTVQTNSKGIIDHIARAWPSIKNKQIIEVIPPQMRDDFDKSYEGNAYGVWHNFDVIREGKYRFVAVLPGDHVLKIDLRGMKNILLEKKAGFVIAAIPTPVSAVLKRFGVLDVDRNGRVKRIVEKPEKSEDAPQIPGRPGWCWASMGIYFAAVSPLARTLKWDADQKESEHDFAKNIIPYLIGKGYLVHIYDYHTDKAGRTSRFIWKDIGKFFDYWEINMDHKRMLPLFFKSKDWPIEAAASTLPPSVIGDSLVAADCRLEKDSIVRHSVLSHGVIVKKRAVVRRSVLFPNVVVGQGAMMRKAIVYRGVHIPSKAKVGFSLKADRARGFIIEDGITVVDSSKKFKKTNHS